MVTIDDMNKDIAMPILFIFLVTLYFSGDTFAEGLPKNAHPNVLGNGWVCDKDYKELDHQCLPMTEEDIQKQNEIIEELNLRSMKRNREDICESERITGAIVCVSITKVHAKCRPNVEQTSFQDCDASLRYDLHTNYKGKESFTVQLQCQVGVEFGGRAMVFTDSNLNSRFRTHKLTAQGSKNNSLNIVVSFVSRRNVVRVKVKSAKCEIISVKLNGVL